MRSDVHIAALCAKMLGALGRLIAACIGEPGRGRNLYRTLQAQGLGELGMKVASRSGRDGARCRGGQRSDAPVTSRTPRLSEGWYTSGMWATRRLPTGMGAVAPVWRGVALAVTATLLWSTTALFIDPLVTTYHLTPVQLSFWRALLVAAALAAALLRRGRRVARLTGRTALFYAVYGLVGVALFNVVWSASVQINKAAVATALIYSAPAFVALGAWPLFGERVTAPQRLAIAVTICGCALVAGITDPAALVRSGAGLALGLASGVSFAAYTLLGKGAGRLGLHDTLVVLFVIFSIAAAALCAWGLIETGPALLHPSLDTHGWILLLGGALGPTLGGYLCFTASLTILSAPVASLFTALEPPITAVLAMPLLGRHMGGPQWLGATLIVGGVLLMQRTALTRARKI